MKHTKLWIIVVFAVILVGSALGAFATQRFEAIQVESSQIEEYRQPPENATVIPELKSIPFDLSLDTCKIVVSKGESVNITVTIYSIEKADLLLTVGTEDDVPTLALMPELPRGIMVDSYRTEISVEAGSVVTVNLTLSIGNQAASGTYTLQIFALQETFHGGVAVGVPLQLTIR